MVAERRGITVEARKVLRASQIEAARARLRAIPMSCIAYLEFIQICCDAFDGEQGVGIARSLDESGAVIVLGNVVFLLGVFRHEHHGRVGGGGGNSGIRAIRWPYRGGGASACAAADPRGSAGGSADEPTSCSKRSMGHLLWSIMH